MEGRGMNGGWKEGEEWDEMRKKEGKERDKDGKVR